MPDEGGMILHLRFFSFQGLPGIDGKDGTPGIPGIKVRGNQP